MIDKTTDIQTKFWSCYDRLVVSGTRLYRTYTKTTKRIFHFNSFLIIDPRRKVLVGCGRGLHTFHPSTQQPKHSNPRDRSDILFTHLLYIFNVYILILLFYRNLLSSKCKSHDCSAYYDCIVSHSHMIVFYLAAQFLFRFF